MWKSMYAPMVHEEITGRLAQLTRGDEAGVLAFAREYGHLGYRTFLPVDVRLLKPHGDPLSWIWTHAETLRFCLEISELLQDGDVDTLKDLVGAQHVTLTEVEKWYKPGEVADIDDVRFLLQQPSLDFRGLSPARMVTERDKVRLEYYNFPNMKWCRDLNGLTYKATLFRNRVINANIEGIRRALPGGSRRSITGRSYWQFTALIETAYWHLADTLDRGRIKRCEECQAPFIQRDKRQRFCPPPASPTSPKRRHSRCGTLKRVHEYRRPK
jgi:hypothetical protein